MVAGHYMVKFILLGHGRCGSSLIVESLAEHSDVLVGDELFHCEEEARCRAFQRLNNTDPINEGESRHYRSGADAMQFLDQVVFDQRPTSVLAVGFKMFYVHARSNPNEKKAWNYLLTDKDIHVIHLIRENLLESYISLRVAFITGEWERFKGTTARREEPARLKLEPRVCEAHFNQELAWRKWARERFRCHPFLEIEYERDVCARFEAVMNEIHDFIDVPRRHSRQLLEKQAQRSPREAIVNYEELKEYFRYTLHEDLFI
jgi:LPS sulfotransferase NodH